MVSSLSEISSNVDIYFAYVWWIPVTLTLDRVGYDRNFPLFNNIRVSLSKMSVKSRIVYGNDRTLMICRLKIKYAITLKNNLNI